jgi:hypothetical protein
MVSAHSAVGRLPPRSVVFTLCRQDVSAPDELWGSVSDEERNVIVASYDWLTDAEMARILLASRGIDARIIDSGIVSVNPLLGNAVGGVKLAVGVADERDALAILEEERNLRAADHSPWCPKCESERVEKRELGAVLKVLAILTLGIAALFFAKSYRCRDCGHTWR